MIDKKQIRQILDDNSNDSGGGGSCWEFTRTDIDNVVNEISNLVEAPVMQKIARENRYTFTGESITGYWIIRDKKDNNDATIFIDCPKEYVPKIVETLNSNFSA